MGSSLSIVNNTENEWRCRLSADDSALKFFKVVIAALATAAGSVSDVTKNAPANSTLATVSNGADFVKGFTIGANIAANFTGNIMKGVDEHLAGQGYALIKPGQTHTWGPMTLSLWQKGTCIRSYPVDDSTVRSETLYMRPIFSGSTAGSNRKHDIAYWINKWNVETNEVTKTA